MSNRRIEEASLNSWPALQQMLYDGWLLRFANGYTKRANSVNPLYGSAIEIDEKVATCERIYQEKGLVPVFRLTPFAAPPNLDDILVQRDYRLIDPTLVMRLDLAGQKFWSSPSLIIRNEKVDDWMDIFCRLGQSSVEGHQTHTEMLELIPSQRFLASLGDSGQIVACCLAVLENGYLGLFDLITDTAQRNKGYGTALMSSLLTWAQAEGTVLAYLQVMENNAPARHIYTAKLGFEVAYRYWYRVSAEDLAGTGR